MTEQQRRRVPEVERVGVELSEQRRQLAEMGRRMDTVGKFETLAGENAGHTKRLFEKVGEVETQVERLVRRTQTLEQAGNRSQAPREEYPPRLVEGRGLAAPQYPGCWPLMSAEQAAAAWPALARWVGEVLCGYYELSRWELPDCWPLHSRAVVELAWAQHSYRAAMGNPSAVADWHTRLLPKCLEQVSRAVFGLQLGGWRNLAELMGGDSDPACVPGATHRLNGAARRQMEPDLMRSARVLERGNAEGALRSLQGRLDRRTGADQRERLRADRPRYLALEPQLERGQADPPRKPSDAAPTSWGPRGTPAKPAQTRGSAQWWFGLLREAAYDDVEDRQRAEEGSSGGFDYSVLTPTLKRAGWPGAGQRAPGASPVGGADEQRMVYPNNYPDSSRG